MKTFPKEIVTLEKIVGGGQTLGTLADGRKVFVWGGLPEEKVEVQLTKSKSKMAEAVVTEVLEPSSERVLPKDPESYLSTSPWQIMTPQAETKYKAQLIDDAFELHHVTLPGRTEIYSDNVDYSYRNKVEFSWFGSTNKRVTRGGAAPTETASYDDVEDGADRAAGPAESDLRSESEAEAYDGSGEEQLDLAFYRRGTQGKVVVDGTSLARAEINQLAHEIRDTLLAKGVQGRHLKALLIRCDQTGNAVWQLYVKDEQFNALDGTDATGFSAQGGEIIYSDPKSPASRITKRLASFGNPILTDTILGVPFRYATEGFFQVNIPVYEQALLSMKQWIEPETQIVDMYSGVGTIGLTIGRDAATLVEINEDAVREMRANIEALGKNAHAVLAPSEKALDYITSDATIILDPPRAGLHDNVTDRLLDEKPPRIIYLSCNPVTQARDVATLLSSYTIVHHQGYNFFPRTPHIEHLVVLDVLVS